MYRICVCVCCLISVVLFPLGISTGWDRYRHAGRLASLIGVYEFIELFQDFTTQFN